MEKFFKIKTVSSSNVYDHNPVTDLKAGIKIYYLFGVIPLFEIFEFNGLRAEKCKK